MPKAYSEDLRCRVLAAREQGMNRNQTGRVFNVSPDAILRWERIKVAEGRTHARQRGGDKRSMKMEAEADRLLGWLSVQPDLTLAELQSRLEKDEGKRLPGHVRHGGRGSPGWMLAGWVDSDRRIVLAGYC